MAADVFVNPLCRQLQRCFADLADLPEITGQLQIDSRRIENGDIFLALNGSRHRGADFIAPAISRGCALVLLEAERDELYHQDSVPVLALKQLRERLGGWLAQISGLDSPDLHLIGITGTNGKTSVSHYLAQLLQGLQQKAAVIGTVGIGALDALKTATHTTPDLVQLHRVLAGLKQDGFNYQAMEVSSHALDQQRTAGVPFQAAVFTNLSRDHLDYHGTMEAYAQAKVKLFTRYPLQVAVLNQDDAASEVIRAACQQQKPELALFSYSLHDPAADLYCQQIQANEAGFQLRLAGRWGEYHLQLPLLGQFNIANALAAACVLIALGFAPQAVFACLEQIQPVAGRMQRLPLQNSGQKQPVIVVDYAHTPDALDNALQAVRSHIKGRLWCVFGCGGDRDAGKRPLMAQVASARADRVVVTSDNPRSEDPERIISHVLKGLEQPAWQVEADRRLAIEQAVLAADADDVILIAGKGHETYQEIQGHRHHFDDLEVARQALALRDTHSGADPDRKQDLSL